MSNSILGRLEMTGWGGAGSTLHSCSRTSLCVVTILAFLQPLCCDYSGFSPGFVL